ncbi:MAG: hypothetical protein FE78DRAFT_151601 [Acidomyces sp. 'richmondensis']|nr:MAG: hypothetical protein FE78DRAFT_151601 [Acidomyces sp. 'richmondensis']
MARVESLGEHIPVALPYLIREGLLPKEPKRELYQWETYVFHGRYGPIEEEVLSTKECVVWSQGDFVRKVYRFGLEGEEVVQAILTCFMPQDSQGRALVVFLKTKAHVYFLTGSSQIIDLPFEIERAFPAPRGCVLQRRALSEPPDPPTPLVPSAPPNSFFSSQTLPSSSLFQSPTLPRDLRDSQSTQQGSLDVNNVGKLDSLFRDILGYTKRSAEPQQPSLYSLTDPLSELGVITQSLQHQRPHLPGKQRPGSNVEFDSLDVAEELVYVSPVNELDALRSQDQGSLILIVTVNNDVQTLSVWHAWYIDEKSLRDLMQQRADHKAAKLRRRSSFLSANIGTGVTTPAVRHRDGLRESIAGQPSRLTGEPSTAVSSRKPTRQEEEAAMATQMDPDYLPATSQTAPRESRRISSLNTDMRASQNAGAGSRRNPSFGGYSTRRSFGHRKSRGSTPGSMFSRSIGADDDLMDLDRTGDFDIDESIESIVRHVRATFEAAGADNVFGSAEGSRRELILRKMHSIPVLPRSSIGLAASKFRVTTLRDTLLSRNHEGHRVNLYIHNRDSQQLTCFRILVKQRPLWPELSNGRQIAVPMIIEEHSLGKCPDMLKLQSRERQVLLLSGRGLLLSSEDVAPCPLPSRAAYRLFSPHALLNNQLFDNDIGKNRLLKEPEEPLTLSHSGVGGRFDEVDRDGMHHRRQLQFEPDDLYLCTLLNVCQAVLPVREASLVRKIWCMSYAWLAENLEAWGTTTAGVEYVAFITTVLFFLVPLIDGKAKAALNMSRLAAGTQQGERMNQQKQEVDSQLFPGNARSRLFSSTTTSPKTRSQLHCRKDQLLVIAAALATDIAHLQEHHSIITLESAAACGVKLMLALHIFREEQKLNLLTTRRSILVDLAPVIAQIGGLLGLKAWSFCAGSYYSLESPSEQELAYVKTAAPILPQMLLMDEPVGVFQWFEYSLKHRSGEQYPTLPVVASLDTKTASNAFAREATPRITALSNLFADTAGLSVSHSTTVELMVKHGIDSTMLETFPEAIAAPFREAIIRCEQKPSTTWPPSLLQLVGREDLVLGTSDKHHIGFPRAHTQNSISPNPRDVQSLCLTIEQNAHAPKSRAARRNAISKLIFSEDRRLVEAINLMHYSSTQMGECPKQPEWDDDYHLEQQRRIIPFMTLRMMALPAGDGLIHYDCVTPLLTEKYIPSGFTTNILMQPMGHNLTIERQWLTEEKCGWAYFHAGASAGMRLSRNVKGIDTSWIAFNKPNELTNRHAGLLLALGLGGHLRSLAKWLSFKYLTPKHTMTSVGLLLGLSASYMGTMDSLITRMLSVHITRMLPPGAAELNVSPITQTAGLMGIGLLYYNTHHRRMSEVMLSEIEYMEIEDPDSGPDPLRDESYRLAAGFALGLINLGKGRHLKGLLGMYLPERLLAMAVGPRPVHAVHVFDRATAGAIIAIALVYMKSGDKSIASKVDIPDTEAQFEHIRPDMLMLRAMARHIIMWDGIVARGALAGDLSSSWIQESLPPCYKTKLSNIHHIDGKYTLDTLDVPFYNILTGLAWALGLKYAGSGDTTARDEILAVVDFLYKINLDAYSYDAKLARSTVRRCIDVMVLATATIMAGSGDLTTFRYLRRLHGRTDEDTPYGSHMAVHLAIGALFMAGGTQTFGTNDLAIASLIIAFYPLFPTEVPDNRVHLQAFRHFWVFAAEARCLVIEDIDTHRPVAMPITVVMRDGRKSKFLTAPCILPELDTIATVQTNDPAYRKVILDFAGNPAHLAAFRRSQTIYVRKCPPGEAHDTNYTAALAMALNESQTSRLSNEIRQSIFKPSFFQLSPFKRFLQAEVELILPSDPYSSVHFEECGTLVDDRLSLQNDVNSTDRDALWNLRVLFAWAERTRDDDAGNLKWLGLEAIEELKSDIEKRAQSIAASNV